MSKSERRIAPRCPESATATSPKPDVILFDHLADSVTIIDGRSGRTAVLVRALQ
jgi:hypothetical protein